jgi:hypothetical protein
MHHPRQHPELSCSRHSRHDGTEVSPTFLTSFDGLYTFPLCDDTIGLTPIQSLDFSFSFLLLREILHNTFKLMLTWRTKYLH